MGFKGTVDYKEVVCRISTWQKNPCQKTECKHHFCHVPHSQSGVEFQVENFPKMGTCPYGKKWSV